jgi:hypothetical protein
MHQQSKRQLQERVTAWSVDEVLTHAELFFSRTGGVYAAFPEKRGPSHLVLRGQGGEELVVAARVTDAGTAVTGSSYLFDQQVARFLDSLPPAAPPAAISAGDDIATAVEAAS